MGLIFKDLGVVHVHDNDKSYYKIDTAGTLSEWVGRSIVLEEQKCVNSGSTPSGVIASGVVGITNGYSISIPADVDPSQPDPCYIGSANAITINFLLFLVALVLF